MFNKIIRFFLEKKIITFIVLLSVITWGIVVSPFDWNTKFLPSDSVAVDAIPNIGPNQQIVYTRWPGHSPKDIQNQISYPLTTALLGVPGVKTIRSSSMFGASYIYIIFKDDIDFYWSRSRILEKLSSLPTHWLPENVNPALGPAATGLGQVYWYTLEGRNPKTGASTGGWNPAELRTLQDYYVSYALTAVDGVTQVGSIGGFVKEYQVNIDPDALRAYQVDFRQVMNAVKESNGVAGAQTMAYNKVEYILRVLGYVKDLEAIEKAVVTVRNNVPIRVEDVAQVQFGPAERRGGLNKVGTAAVGGVVVARYGSNPMQVIENIKEKIKEISASFPSKVLENGEVSKVTIVPFYDRSQLIQETLGTLSSALSHEILISIIVIIAMLLNMRASFIVSLLLPIGVLATFIIMKYSGVTANILSLSGIAIAIGVMVDIGIVITENIIQHIEKPQNKNKRGKALLEVIYEGTIEIAPAIVTAIIIVIVSFLPVFSLQGEAGRLFKPLAFTKTFALTASLFLGIIAIPALCHLIFGLRIHIKLRSIVNLLLLPIGLFIVFYFENILGLSLLFLGINQLLVSRVPRWSQYRHKIANTVIISLTVAWFLSEEWLPLGVKNGVFLNFIFVLIIVGGVLGSLMCVVYRYSKILSWCLRHKKSFLTFPILLLLFGIVIWKGFSNTFGFIKSGGHKINWPIEHSVGWQQMDALFPGLGKDFMPDLSEGTFLLMPSAMAHTSVSKNIEIISEIDRAIDHIPEVKSVVGKWGHVNSALDPAPTSMYEIIIDYKSKYKADKNGHPLRFKVDDEGNFILKNEQVFNPEKDRLLYFDTGLLIPDEEGNYFRQWRENIHSPNDIWRKIAEAGEYPGLTTAPKLQPIQTRLMMTSTGLRSPIGIKIQGTNLADIEAFGFVLEDYLKQLPQLNTASVFADRIVGKPYLEIDIDRDKISRYGLHIKDVQDVVSAAVGGKRVSTVIDGRRRFAISMRYGRELRNNPDALRHILLQTAQGALIPLQKIADIRYRRGPQMIRSENAFLTGYVVFAPKNNISEIEAVNAAKSYINKKIKAGEIIVPEGITYKFAGNYLKQQKTTKRLAILIPVSLLVILLILYLLFNDVQTSVMVFFGIFVAFAGGFVMMWLYGQEWFLNFTVFDKNIHQLFNMAAVNIDTAVWVGFIALAGLATNDGVIMATYIKQVFAREKPENLEGIRTAIITAGRKRVRPAMMTTAIAIIALIPILTSTGRGSDIMIPMAIPLFGGMLFQVMTMFVVPVLYASWQERRLKNKPQKTIKTKG